MAEKEELGVDDLAKFMKKTSATVRGLLRKSKVKRSGKSYTWPSKTAMQAAAKKLGHSPAPAKKKKATAETAAA